MISLCSFANYTLYSSQWQCCVILMVIPFVKDSTRCCITCWKLYQKIRNPARQHTWILWCLCTMQCLQPPLGTSHIRSTGTMWKGPWHCRRSYIPLAVARWIWYVPQSVEYSRYGEGTDLLKIHKCGTHSGILFPMGGANTYGVAKELANIIRPLVGQFLQHFVENITSIWLWQWECMISYNAKALLHGTSRPGHLHYKKLQQW